MSVQPANSVIEFLMFLLLVFNYIVFPIAVLYLLSQMLNILRKKELEKTKFDSDDSNGVTGYK
ncbi:MAG: hypothetical protein A3I89_01035 [Candidatus Harrisonbacteria bacterium RIFCSPLOWO2_02_FULL_41_11]|uniref:Uncharacterized protein n=1 Tax=Candidatus Harrisonbacteria bacterium RIFCSPHIGHO2_02_FULL_42_16 TaxID=1798404 RepID=A0A1G1ZFI9_9BACT|nr:MAG: hypothetical protein A3B92_03820 [Candidatus Harrisonbacteria bacterium RIFCSPHIGHO2_02_FULL_42_16]OGY66994.1 MAG: hypothetical protein A3I89_01035 [Candidatus Harrisonbacteria bacterium RIFCSPLOWO2_02_FULL_41_11]